MNIFICDGDGRRESCQALLLSGEASCEGRDVLVSVPISQRLHPESFDDQGVHDDLFCFEVRDVGDG